MNNPKLRFKADDGNEFPEWKEKRLGDLFKISAGGDIDKENCSKSFSLKYPYPVYANALVNRGLYGYANYYKVQGDTFTVTGRGDVGYAVARHGKYVPIVRLLVCEPKENDNVDFFAEQVNGVTIFVESTGVPQLTAPQLGKVKVKRPSLPEQRKIAAFLSTIDEIITTTEAELKAWEERKKGVMQKIFNREVRFKADDGSEFPEWEEKKLGDVLSICHGKDYKHLSSGMYPVLGTGGVITHVNSYLCNWECALIGRKGTIDKPQYMDKPFWCVDTLFYTKPEKQQFPKWQYYLFQIINWNKYNEASGVPSLSASTIENILVDVPSLPEQKKIADCLSSLDDVINQIQAELSAWKEFKKGLLQQMFV